MPRIRLDTQDQDECLKNLVYQASDEPETDLTVEVNETIDLPDETGEVEAPEEEAPEEVETGPSFDEGQTPTLTTPEPSLDVLPEAPVTSASPKGLPYTVAQDTVTIPRSGDTPLRFTGRLLAETASAPTHTTCRSSASR